MLVMLLSMMIADACVYMTSQMLQRRQIGLSILERVSKPD